MSMTPERENWAIAAFVEREYGSLAESFIDDRIHALLHDEAGQAKWRAIKACYAQLQGTSASSRS